MTGLYVPEGSRVIHDAGPDTPPDDTEINGRKAEPWEQERIREAKLAQRAECASLLDGVTRTDRAR